MRSSNLFIISLQHLLNKGSGSEVVPILLFLNWALEKQNFEVLRNL